MFSKLKKFSGVKPESLVSFWMYDAKLRKIFEAAYDENKEKQVLTLSTVRYRSCSEYGSRGYNQADKKNGRSQHANCIFTEEMLKRYNETEIKEMLTNDPEKFFSRGWCYPNNQWSSFLMYKNIAGTGYGWNFILPESFWENADNIQLFYGAAEKYWNAKIQPFITNCDNISESDICEMAYLALGFKIKAIYIKERYESSIDKRISSLMETRDKTNHLNKPSIDFFLNNLRCLESEKGKLLETKPFNCAGFAYIFQQNNKNERANKDKRKAKE